MSWELAASAASSIIGGVLGNAQARAQERAAADYVRRTQQVQGKQFGRTRAAFEPYQEYGLDALANLQDPQANFMSSPGYEFMRNEGMRGIENRASVGSMGGNFLAGMADYTTGLAQQDYGNWWNRQMQGVGIGMDASGTIANAGMNQANAMTNAYGYQAGANTEAAGTRYGSFNNAAQSGISNMLYGAQRGWFDKKPPPKGSGA